MQNPFNNDLEDIQKYWTYLLQSIELCDKHSFVSITFRNTNSHSRAIVPHKFYEKSNAPMTELAQLHSAMCEAMKQGHTISITTELI